ncbi:MAG: YfjI family protein [Undibacterium umbellatum]|uniref:YfjI family protein n=1 Tax=Undibacterium umbellatum TaxID=2762300 RepID=UPI003BB69EA4
MNSPSTNTQNPNLIWNFRPDFPTASLPPILQNVIYAVKANTQAPLVLVVSSALAAISLACQRHLVVRRPNGLEGPVSLFSICIAESGERKSTVDAIFTKPIREFEIAQEKKFSKKLNEYFAELSAWKIEVKAVSSAIKKHKKQNECNVSLEEKLAEVLLREPRTPNKIKLLYSDTTPEALQYGLSENGKSAGIFADEGGIFFDGYGKGGLPAYNALWSGSSINVARRSMVSFTLENARLTMSVMVQEKVFQKYLAQHGDLARSNGFFARCLVTYPCTTQGTRFLQNQLPLTEPIDTLHKRLTEILEHNEKTDVGMITLIFSGDAAQRWIEIYNQIEGRLGPNGYFADMKDFAAKMAENIARVAALFHYLENDDGEISLVNVNRAIDVICWYAEEFRQLFVPPPSIPAEQSDASVLQHWLTQVVGMQGCRIVKKNSVLKLGPYSLRSKKRLDAAIEYLAVQNKLVLYLGDRFGNMRFDGKTTWIDFNGMCQQFTPVGNKYLS